MLKRSSAIKSMVLGIGVLLLCTTHACAITEDQSKPDELCQMLFQEYVVRNGKFNDGGVYEACDLIACRGRMKGFWRPVLDELRKENNRSQTRCLRILGLMLESDAMARDYIKAGTMTAAIQRVCLPSELVPELITRAGKAENYLFDYYVVTLARARDERCQDFFLKVLENRDGDYNESPKFHAAVGLANLGNPKGVEWMIAHCEKSGPDVWLDTPSRNKDLDTCCLLALRSLANCNNLRTRADFENWWAKLPRPFVPNWPIALRY